jgi:hypothetical protein
MVRRFFHIERKTGWLLAEQAGLERPYRMRSLVGAACGMPMRCAISSAPVCWKRSETLVVS